MLPDRFEPVQDDAVSGKDETLKFQGIVTARDLPKYMGHGTSVVAGLSICITGAMLPSV